METPGARVTAQLEQAALEGDFEWKCDELAESWKAANLGIEIVEPILRFMEQHPGLDYGIPGALVHFVEQYYRKGYDDLLFQSVERRPTPHTICMLNRLINGCKSAEERQRLLELLRFSRVHPLADENTVKEIDHFLNRGNG